jgi:hypothetical protein
MTDIDIVQESLVMRLTDGPTDPLGAVRGRTLCVLVTDLLLVGSSGNES